MLGNNLLKNVKITLVEAGASANTTDLTSDGVDMQGFEGVLFVGSIATANAANYAYAQQGADNSSDWENLAGTQVVPGDNGDSFCIDVYRPTDRYVRCYIERGGASTATGDVYAIQYGAAKVPTTQGSTIDAEMHASPSEGTI